MEIENKAPGWRALEAGRALRTADRAGVAQLARARAFQARGRGFESRLPLQAQRFSGRVEVSGSRSSVGRARPW